MLDILSSPSTITIPGLLLDISFDRANVGDTTITDSVSGRAFSLISGSAGSVIDDPALGKCFNFTGASGFKWADGQSVDVANKNVRIVADFKPSDTTGRTLFYTGSSINVTVEGYALYTNVPSPWGDVFFLQSNGFIRPCTGLAVNTNRRVLECRMGNHLGNNYGTKVGINGAEPTGVGIAGAAPSRPGPTLYIGMLPANQGTVYPPFRGLLKSIKMYDMS